MRTYHVDVTCMIILLTLFFSTPHERMARTIPVQPAWQSASARSTSHMAAHPNDVNCIHHHLRDWAHCSCYTKLAYTPALLNQLGRT